MPRNLGLLVESVGVMGVCAAAFRLAPRLATAVVLRQVRSKPAPIDPRRATADASTVQDVARVVARAARLVPRTTCLSRATAAALMLRRRGIASSLRVSAETAPAAGFTAHAWLESGGLLVVGPRGEGPAFDLADG